MSDNLEFKNIVFDLPKNQSNVIKVIGVGGGGSNAVNYMFRKGINGVDFVISNTDAQALNNSNVPNKIQLGVNLTEGLGAGADPEVGRQSALESILEIEKMLDNNTKILFITAGMGGGTGTGAAPEIARLAKSKARDILTVGIVTMPFSYEGKLRQEQALTGIEELRKYVDSLIIINNNKLREVYGNLGYKEGYSKADEVLATAARGIAEVITHHHTQNIDLRDARTVLQNSGTAIMGSATAAGESRAKEAVSQALDSPLLNDNKIKGAKNVLLLIVSGTDEIKLDEIGEINDYIQYEAGNNTNIIMGVGENELLENSISVTIIATGFDIDQQREIANAEPKKIIHTLEENQRSSVHNLTPKKTITFSTDKLEYSGEHEIFELDKTTDKSAGFQTEQKDTLVEMTDFIRNLNVTFDIVSPIEDLDFTILETAVQTMADNSQETEITNTIQQTILTFDEETSNKEKEEIKVVGRLDINLEEEIKEIKVNEPVQFVPVTEEFSDGIIKYSLEEYTETDDNQKKNKQEEKVTAQEEISMVLRQVEEAKEEKIYLTEKELSPIEMPINELSKYRAKELKMKFKEFNHKFRNNIISQYEEYDKVPAYKRQGLEIDSVQKNTENSRISIATDDDNNIKIRSNNSFLHDNVD